MLSCDMADLEESFDLTFHIVRVLLVLVACFGLVKSSLYEAGAGRFGYV